MQTAIEQIYGRMSNTWKTPIKGKRVAVSPAEIRFQFEAFRKESFDQFISCQDPGVIKFNTPYSWFEFELDAPLPEPEFPEQV